MKFIVALIKKRHDPAIPFIIASGKSKTNFLALLLILLSINSYGCRLEKGFERLKIYDYFKAKYYFEKSLRTKTAGASYGLSIIYSSNNNPFFNLDTARVYIMLADSAYKTDKPKTISFYKKMGISNFSIESQKNLICDQALKSAASFSSIEKFNDYISKFSLCSQVIEAVSQRNSVAYQEAKKINTAASYNNFIQHYPDAKDRSEAENFYQQRLYEEAIQDKQITSYENFLQQHPASPYRIQAENAIYSLAVVQKTIEQYDSFIKKYPGNNNINDAWHELYNLYMKNYNEQLFEKFKSTYPDFPFKNELESDYRLQSSYLLPFKKDSLWGFINEAGQEIIKPSYDDVTIFSEGLAAVSKNEKMGYINKSGNMVIPFIYDDAELFKKNTAVISSQGKFGLINRNNDELIPAIYDELAEPADNFSMAVSNEKSGYVNTSGKTLTEFIFDYASDFKDGFAIVAIDEKYGLINITGTFSIALKYDELIYFSPGLLKAKLNGKNGIINYTGSVILPFEFEKINHLHNNRALIVNNNKCGFTDATGKIVIPVKFTYTEPAYDDEQFENGFIELPQKNKKLVIDSSGNVFSMNDYDENRIPSENLIAVRKKQKWGYADKTGKLKIALKYDEAGAFTNGFAVVKYNKLMGIIDRNANYIVDPLYTNITTKNNLLMMNLSGNYGLTDYNGKKLLDTKYDKIEFITDKIVSATKGQQIQYLNLSTGSVIISYLK